MSLHFPPSKLPWPFGRRETVAPEPAPAPATEVVPLTAALAHELRLSWASRFTADRLAHYLEQGAGWAWCVPGSGEYLIAEGWRHRDDLAILLEVRARRARADLLAAAVAALPEAGVGALLVPDDEWLLHGRFYHQVGFDKLERIVYYQLGGLRLPLPLRRPLPALTFTPVGLEQLETVVAVDHASFPWLWWNSAAEFASYLRAPGVRAVLGWDGDRPVGYAGFTITRDWGHLDRLAVAGDAQGRGWGAALLAHALEVMAGRGVTRVTLSTQETNTQSQRLYRGFGFRQTFESQWIYGRWLGEGPRET